ncbi:sugar O-acetyltransferase [Anditalea andensis]|uniref:Acetyltransferase n=1 Tax=Anditalea andensis TaxID=1048983 RepID=A0A074KTT8_9BACT|nr:sugar O-acetyltransferase [Anditalea andensis]KEO72329.1 maltose acetyltransferase [Anditalea andensis]
MKSEKEKMLNGELYDPLAPDLVDERIKTRLLLKALNDGREDQPDERTGIIKQLMPNAKEDLWLQPPFFCDYGSNIYTGNKVFFNFNCVVLDVMKVDIGDRALFGPNVQIYTATHPLDHHERASGLEYAKAISIGKDVWIGGSAVICPGVSIGDRTIIGAGSVVTRDIPADVFAAGNPCKVIRKLNEGGNC